MQNRKRYLTLSYLVNLHIEPQVIMSNKDLFWIFPDYPNIKQNSKTSDLALQHLVPSFTKDERDDKIEEYIGLGIIEPCRNREYVLTQKGWEIWNNDQ